MPRSLKVAREHLDKVKITLLNNNFPSQRALALNLGLALSTVSRFCTGKPVDYSTFVDICDLLGLEWRNIADLGHVTSVNAKIGFQDIAIESTPKKTKVNFSTVARERVIFKDISSDKNTISTETTTSSPRSKIIPFPEGAVAPDSIFYQTRDNIELTVCTREVDTDGVIINR